MVLIIKGVKSPYDLDTGIREREIGRDWGKTESAGSLEGLIWPKWYQVDGNERQKKKRESNLNQGSEPVQFRANRQAYHE